MKKLPLPGFGSLGAEIVDIDLVTASDDEIMELGQGHLEDLITLVRRDCVGNISLDRFHYVCNLWAEEIPGGGYLATGPHSRLEEKYGPKMWTDHSILEDFDRKVVEDMVRMTSGIEHLRGMARVSGIRDEEGNATGMFADGELDWHSNQQGTNDYAPAVGLLASQGSVGSRTEFLNTVDAYLDLSPEWQRRCDELIAVHRWRPNSIAPGLNEVQDYIVHMNMCPDDDVKVPLVNVSPIGLRGLHFPYTTIHHFDGLTQKDSDEVIAFLKAHLIQDKYIYGHDWQDGDLMFFDNTVTLHCRPTIDCTKRLMYRMCFNYDRLLKQRRELQRAPLAPPEVHAAWINRQRPRQAT